MLRCSWLRWRSIARETKRRLKISESGRKEQMCVEMSFGRLGYGGKNPAPYCTVSDDHGRKYFLLPSLKAQPPGVDSLQTIYIIEQGLTRGSH
jgi:hypothetical protein